MKLAWKLTASPADVGEADRRALRRAGFSSGDIYDISEIVGLFNLSNRMAMGLDMMPNREYHAMSRTIAKPGGGKARAGRKPGRRAAPKSARRTAKSH